MTTNQAAGLRGRWKERADLSADCEHLNLEMEWDELGHSTGNITCFICRELVVHKPPEFVSHWPTTVCEAGLSCYERDGRRAVRVYPHDVAGLDRGPDWRLRAGM